MKFILFIYSVFSVFSVFGQLTANGNSGMQSTSYTNGSPNDPIYIWCAEGIGINTASLTATPTSGTGPWTFNWYFHNETSSSWEPYFSQSGTSSTINNVPSDGYRVQIYDNNGVAVACHTAWVWNMNADLSVSQNTTSCNSTNLNGALTVAGSFTYYNPPPPESLITSNTNITVCFSGTHSYVSDLAFYLVGPPSIGSPTVLLSPNPGANGQGSVCNSNNNVNNLCFSSASTNTFDPCDEECCGFLCLSITSCTSNYTGTYGRYGPGNTPINWAPIYGANAAEGGWAVQIYDCIGSDVGSLTNATVSFSNLSSICGGASTITYSSGAINSSINDNSCTPTTASIFQVPMSPTFANPINLTANVSYQWTANTAASIPNATSSLTPSVTNIPSGNNDFTLTATVSIGSTSCSYNESISFNSNCCSITANAGTDVSFCTGGSAQIGTATSGAIYSWSPTTGLSDATVAQPTVSLTNTTNSTIIQSYTLTVTDPNDPTCFTSDQVDVTVFPQPLVNAGTYLSICIDAADIPLSGTPVGGTFSGIGVSGTNFDPSVGTQTITYSFTDANNCSNSATTTITVNSLPNVDAGQDQTVCQGAIVTLSGNGAQNYTWNNNVSNGVGFIPLNSQTYQVTGTDANGCVNTDQVIITVNPVPTVSVNNASICAGSQQTLTAVPSLPNGSFSWSTNETSSSIQVAPNQTTTYTVTYTLNGCTSLVSNALVTVNPLPNVQAGIDQSICVGSSVTLTATGANSLVWNNNVSNGIAFTPTNTQTYTVIGTDLNGCINTDQVIVTVNALPTISAGTNSTICFGQNVTLSGSGGVSYVWDNNVQNGTSFTPPLGSNTYTVIGTDANGCSNTSQVTINVVPEPTVSFTPSLAEGYSVFSVTFENTSSNANNYFWDFGNGESITTTSLINQTTNYTDIGTYTVLLIASNGICQDQVTGTVIVLPYPDAIIKAPNVFTPNGDNLNDEWWIDVQFGAKIDVQLFNRWGNLVLEMDEFTDKWDGKDFADGVYFYKYVIQDMNGKEYQGHGSITLLR